MILIRSVIRVHRTVQMLQAHADAFCVRQPDNQHAARARVALSDAYASLGRAITELSRGHVSRVTLKPPEGVTHVPQRPDEPR